MTAYGMARWPERLARTPQEHEGTIIARVQSMRTRNGARAEPLSYEDSIAYLRDAERKHRVTVPQPLCQPAPQQRTDSPPVAAARAGSSLPSGLGCDRKHGHSAGRQSIPYVPPPKDIDGWGDYIRRALAGEILPF